MHIPYRFFGDGLTYFDEKDPPAESYKHQFKNVIYGNYLEKNTGARIIIDGALTPEMIVSRKKAKSIILEQIRYIDEFAEANADKFVVAKTPAEVRHYIHNTDKTVILHSIEGARKLVNSQEDAYFWAAQGIVFMTLIHLVDDEFGGAAIKPGLTTKLLNYKGMLKIAFRRTGNESRGLKEKGKQAIKWLANAGIMTDITHMSEQTRREAITFMGENRIPPLSTHDHFKPIQNHPRGIPKEDLLRIYQPQRPDGTFH